MISKTQVQNILKTYAGNLKTDKVNKSNEVKQKLIRPDELAISGESKIKQRVMQTIKQTDDVRHDLVNALSQQISAGTYERSADEVAEKMISRVIVDEIV